MNKNAVSTPVSLADFEANKSWGLSALIDLSHCDIDLISSEEQIRKFVVELCEEIGMKRHGDTYLDRFGDGVLVSEGYSFMQFIETSSITAHFEEPQKKAFIDIFSCKYFDSELAAKFCQKYFKASERKIRVIIRN
jgi:S-adenosylmethionine decarboxylase